jgi:hypothetical protein
VQCVSCGAAFEPGQEYCLECGARILRPTGTIAALGRGWRRRLGWYPGDWIWGALLGLAVAAAGAAAAIELPWTAESTAAPRPIVATQRLRLAPEPPAPLAVSTPAPLSTSKGKGTPPPAPARPRPPAKRGLTEWPRRSGYTVVLSSIPASVGEAGARSKALDALRSGLPQVGVLVSSRYASLHPGYYVVFSGIYASLEEAQSAVQRASSKFPSAYARQIAP